MGRTIHVSLMDRMIVPLQVFGDVCIGKIGYMVLRKQILWKDVREGIFRDTRNPILLVLLK